MLRLEALVLSAHRGITMIGASGTWIVGGRHHLHPRTVPSDPGEVMAGRGDELVTERGEQSRSPTRRPNVMAIYSTPANLESRRRASPSPVGAASVWDVVPAP